MRIAEIAPLAESVPPKLYGGTGRVERSGGGAGRSPAETWVRTQRPDQRGGAVIGRLAIARP